MNIENLSEREILALQYSLLEELKQKPKETVITATIENAPTQSAEEFVKQRFTDNDGNYENNDQYVCRLKWFELGCPKYNKFANKSDYTYGTIKNLSYMYNWRSIRQKAMELGYSHKKPNKFIDNTKKTIKRDSKEYNRFHEFVLKRDKYCKCCGNKEDLVVHHIMPFNKYNSLGADTNNGIVLCKECHSKYHSEYGYKKEANAVTFSLFLRDYGMNPKNELTSNLSSCDLKEIFSVTDLIK